MLLQKEMFKHMFDDIKPFGCTFNSASSVLFIKNFGFASYSSGYMQQIHFVVSQTKQTLTTFTPYIPSTKKHDVLLT